MFKALSSTISDVDPKGRVVVAANAFGNIDSDRDISMPGSFTKTIKENFARLKWFLNHDRNTLLGIPLQAQETKDYLEVVGQLNMDKQVSRDIYADYQLYAEYGKSLEHSIGVDPIKYLEDREGNVRRVTEWKWWEYSTLTSWGANENTPMLAIKNAGSITGAIDWLSLKMKKGNYTDETFNQIDETLAILKSLSIEPERSTQNDAQPILVSDLADISTSFINSLKQTA